MILHIPHASTNTLQYELQNRERELLRMTDWFTDELYSCREAIKIVFGVSRLICDVERFEDDTQETMSRFGKGVCYTTDTEGTVLREVSDASRQAIITDYYRPHHQGLSDAVDHELASMGRALVVDCHSFPDVAYYFNSDFGKRRPDICIGTDTYHTPPELVETVKEYFTSKGYVVQIDDPYAGTLVPLKHYGKNRDVHGIMIEINRKLYMDDDGTKSNYYEVLKQELGTLLESLKERYAPAVNH